MRRFAVAALIAADVLLVSLAVWILVPGPTIPLLALSVLASEESPLLAVLAAGALVATEYVARGRARIAGMACAATACGLALIPLLLVPGALRAADDEMRSALGVDWRLSGSDEARARMQPSAFVPWRLLDGPPAGTGVRVERALPVSGSSRAIDVYHPAGEARHPAVLVIYGGAWMFGDRSAVASICNGLAARGYVAVALDYRHAPEYRWPAQRDDIAAEIAAVARHAAAWNVDVQRVAFWGLSAGAQLALMAAADAQPIAPAAVVAEYPPTDLRTEYDAPPRPDPADTRTILRTLFGGPPDPLHAALYASASPWEHVRAGWPPTLLIEGDRDELVRPRFVRAYGSRLRAEGARVVSIELPWANHAFDAIPNGIGGQIARYYAERFLAATIGT